MTVEMMMSADKRKGPVNRVPTETEVTLVRGRHLREHGINLREQNGSYRDDLAG
jgi:hypothetical protein